MSSLRFPEILIGRTWCGKVTGDLSTVAMSSGQRRGECDTTAGDLYSHIVWIGKWHGNGDGVVWAITADTKTTASAGDGSNNRCLKVCITVYSNGLTGAKAFYAGNRDNCCAHFGGSTYCSAPCCTNSLDNNGLAVYASINDNLLTNAKVCHTCDFNIV